MDEYWEQDEWDVINQNEADDYRDEVNPDENEDEAEDNA